MSLRLYSSRGWAVYLICPVMDERRCRKEGVFGQGPGGPVGDPVPAFQYPITGMCRDAPARDDCASLTGLQQQHLHSPLR
ncbi:hypothetical protein CesoFtcFv8_006107 [Champsocephalus esox]|uniref:Uncharacterized protein n=1 Tax=Champsocephalus esox TaxID=159716 RepID=A0AAN8CIX4_9TELE|nr:hypothetical protein CesoFtcFv8_006107 [Champsocephalus esox]